MIRPHIPDPILQQPASEFDSDDEDLMQSEAGFDFTGQNSLHDESEEVIEEERKGGSPITEQQRMDDNMVAFEKKLSNFERMFLFINDELDFRLLGEMAEDVERYKRMNQKEPQLSVRSRLLNIRDNYGFIQPEAEQEQIVEEDDDDDFLNRMRDRRSESVA